MKFLKIILILCIAVILFSCSRNEENAGVKNSELVSSEQTDINSGRPVYDGTPEEISGQIKNELEPFYEIYGYFTAGGDDLCDFYEIDKYFNNYDGYESEIYIIDTSDNNRIINKYEYKSDYLQTYDYRTANGFGRLKTAYSDVYKYLINYFSREIADGLLKKYIIIDNEIYYKIIYGMDRTSDISYGGTRYSVEEYSDTKIVYAAVDTHIEDYYEEEPKDIIETPYKLVREYIDGKWVFTDFREPRWW